MSVPTTCPACRADLRKNEIPLATRDAFGGATHFSRVLGIYSLADDATVGWQCPDCGQLWARTREEELSFGLRCYELAPTPITSRSMIPPPPPPQPKKQWWRGRVELLGLVAVHLALSLILVDWRSIAALSAGQLAVHVVGRFLIPLGPAVWLWFGRHEAWRWLVGLLALRAVGELIGCAVRWQVRHEGWDSCDIRSGLLLAAGYAALAVWVWLSPSLRRLSRASGR
jgi:hypothetical protein